VAVSTPGATARDARASAALGAAFAVLAAGYALLLGSLDAVPYQDAPNHLARAVISADLLFHGGARFGAAYALRLEPGPYLLGDLALAALVEGLGPYAAGRVFAVLVAASLPAAVAVALRAAGASRPTVLLGATISLYLATDWFFLMGFQAFRLAIAFVLLALAAFGRYLETGSPRAFAAYAACLTAGWLTHLSTLLFVGAGAALLGACALRAGRAPLARVARGALPLLALGAWQLATAGVAPEGATIRDSWGEKARRLASPFRRFDRGTDAALLLLLAAAGLLLLGGVRAAWRRERVRAPAALALLFLALYAAMPLAHGYAWYIDCRALPLAVLFALFAALASADGAPGRRGAAAALAVLLAASNLAVLAARLVPMNAELRAYRAIAARLTPGATVLPVATRPKGAVDFFLHAGLFATIEVGARTPYLFAGGVTRHFTARDVPPAPPEAWYRRGLGELDPGAIACTYRYLLVTKPYEPGRLGVPTAVVAENGTAALLEVRLAPCGHGPRASSTGSTDPHRGVVRVLDGPAAPR
jgi:hypothetical protein